MTISKRVLILFTMIITTIQLAACGIVTHAPSATVTTLPSLTPSVAPTNTEPPSKPLSTSTPTPISSAPNGLRMAYIIDKNLYFQDGDKTPVQLTYSGDDLSPTFSNDGEKIIFYRGLVPHELYSININGTQEQALVTGSLLEVLNLGLDKFTEIISLAFVPGAHQILFNTRQLSQEDIDQKDFNRLGSKDNLDLLSVNTDTGEIKRLLPKGRGGNFFISPDGNMVAVQAKSHIDVFDIKGNAIRRNLVTYTPTHPYTLNPNIFWASDSTELIVTLPTRAIDDMSGPESLSVWRYAIDGSGRVQVALNPHPLDGGDYSVSPDGNWILYNYFYYPGKTDETVPSGLYLGNLHTGDTKLYSVGIGSPAWSPDSMHFVYDGLFLGVADGSPISIGDGSFLGWGDLDHYLYSSNGEFVIGKIDGEAKTFSIGSPGSTLEIWPYAFTFIFTNR